MIRPVQDKPTEYFTDKTGNDVRIEYFRQGDYHYKITWRDGKDPLVEPV